MESLSPLSPSKSKTHLSEDLLLLSMSTLFLCWGMYSGVQTTYDSFWYQEGAQFLQDHAWHRLFEHRTFLAKPPLYPVLLFLIHKQAAYLKWIHVFFWTCTVGLSFGLINRYLPDPSPRIGAKLLLVWATPLYLIHMFWWSEPLFLFWGSIYFGLHQIYFRRPGGTILGGIILCGLGLIFTRHIGIIFCGVSALYLLFRAGFSAKRTSWGLWLNLALGPLLFTAWHYAVIQKIRSFKILNYTLELDLPYNLWVMGQGFAQWFIPLPWAAEAYLNIPILLLVLVFLVYETYTLYRARLWMLALLALNTWAYVGLMLLKGDLLPDDIERYLSLVYVPLMILLMYRLSQYKNTRLPVILLSIWMLYPALRALKNLYFWSGLSF